MEPQTIGDQGPAIVALYRLLKTFPHLPAADFRVGTVILRSRVVEGISITLYSSFSDFETWREALGIDVNTVEWQPKPDLSYEVLKGGGSFADVAVDLSGLIPREPEPVPVTAAAAL
ncbi:hypothetical protein [Streptomyces sp. ISL-11]|uniref:hypothetical protein n=1 Tax=Streptomyces sp. ISL-11 TaxID=2819174 RepID=UPI001BEA9565|nr:hypothetical protein [Streptomyces sp. ISL-11]MBT2383004.1 hypothetical protein [Streptomyces sp. ISL-11]